MCSTKALVEFEARWMYYRVYYSRDYIPTNDAGSFLRLTLNCRVGSSTAGYAVSARACSFVILKRSASCVRTPELCGTA